MWGSLASLALLLAGYLPTNRGMMSRADAATSGLTYYFQTTVDAADHGNRRPEPGQRRRGRPTVVSSGRGRADRAVHVRRTARARWRRVRHHRPDAPTKASCGELGGIRRLWPSVSALRFLL